MSAHDEQQAPTAEAIAAMYIFHDEYAAQREGAVDFYAHLSHGNKQVVKDLLAALRRASPETGWQPIETAPKDGPIMLWDGEYVTQGGWCSSGDGYWLVAEANDFSGPGWTPTHWQPLPPAPRPQEAE